MGMAVEFQKIMTEIVYVNLPGPEEPEAVMSGSELLHGFLADLHAIPSPEFQTALAQLCIKWNVHYRNKTN
jgi:hypothetical protein